MSGPHALLDGCRSGDEAPRLPTLLQRPPHACRAGRTHARPERRLQPRTRDAHVVSLAGALSWAVSHTDRDVTDRPRLTLPSRIPRGVPHVLASSGHSGQVKRMPGRGFGGRAETRVPFATVC